MQLGLLAQKEMGTAINKFGKLLQKWYLPLIIGIFFIMVAIGIYSTPSISISAIMLLFSLTVLAFGLREVVFVVTNRMLIRAWVWHLLAALLTVAAGVLLLSNPFISLIYINTVVVILLFAKAVHNFLFHYTYSKRNECTIGMNWIYSVALIFIGIFLWYRPQIISAVLVTLSGLPFLLMGLISIGLSLTLRRTYKKLEAFKSSFRKQTEDIDYEDLTDSKTIGNSLK